MGPSVAQRYGQQAAQCSNDFLYKAIDISNGCDLSYRTSNNKRLLVELMLIKLCQLLAPAQVAPSVTSPLQKVSPATSSNQPSAPSQPTAVQQMPQQNKVQQPISSAAVLQSQAVQPPRATVSGTSQLSQPPKAPMPRMVPPSISIKKPQVTTETQIKKETGTVTEMNNPFTVEDLQRAWVRFTQTIPTETVLVNTMISCKPQMQSALHFEVVVDNQAQVKLVQEKGVYILPFLKQELQNTHISMSVRESARAEKQKAFSQREKLNMMVQKNPYIRQFADKFGLELT